MRYDLRPFPALWKAFEHDAEVRDKLNRGVPFETLTEASRQLALSGVHVARVYLVGGAADLGPVMPELDRETLYDAAVAK